MKLPIVVSEDSKQPIYHQIEMQVKTLIVSGQLPAHTLLPSIRALSSELACSVITTRRAYQNLENDGFIKTVQGKGTFVKELDHSMKQNTKQEVILSALQQAIEQAELMGSTREEIRIAFDEIMNQKG
ncbi:GntR family transcriptional regulator [Alkalihalobacillus hemicellulosilyticus]|uniref:Transcriptional regulator n=1 Tax=Halalkalibacter hemicellulosilyticusJCM 9152 TaxID=1236971 RepID=W4Q9Z9_9BACI|nr:GntR family transcriptional regulator [Halalkalibacter hemicellulosilyticus]GAE28807.1 transcriptional regulator [Halalkalibacter hemicellulosilyticusJCM 9152]